MLTAVVIVAAAPVAGAQQGDVDSARAAAERGRREYNLGHWQQSIEGFEKAYQLSGDAAFLFNLGQAHRQLGHFGEALRLYRTYLRERPDASNRDVAEKQIKELEAQEARAPASTKPTPGPTTPATAPPKPAPASTPPPAAKPAPSPATSPPKPASAPTPPAAAKPAPGPTPTPGPTSAPGPTAPAAAPATATTTTTAGSPTLQPAPSPTTAPAGALVAAPAAPPPPGQTPLPRWLPLVGAAMTVAATAAATIVGLQASSRYDDLRATCGQTASGCSADQIDGVRSRDNAATILWVSAGVLAAATGVAIVVNTHAAGASALW